MDQVTGKTLIEWGHEPGPWFAGAVKEAEALRASGADEAALRRLVASLAPASAPTVGLQERGALPYHLNIRAGGRRRG